MRQFSDAEWNSITPVQEGEFDRLPPGGYIVQIVAVEDREDKEGLLISYDIVRGDYIGYAKKTDEQAGFWPLKTWVSYKQTALKFFKGFVTSVEMSTPKFRFNPRDPQCLLGKYFGAVIGDEEYIKNSGEVGLRHYTAQKRSVQAVQQGDFKEPEFKKLKGGAPAPSAPVYPATPTPFAPPSAPTEQVWAELKDDDGELPF